jgi:protein-S-isoprenylcysteine O-methyltransferase Ste14
MTDPVTPRHPGVKFPAPFLFLLGLALAWVLETRLMRIRLAPTVATENATQLFGVALLVAGLMLMLWGLLTFARAKTGIIPIHPATQIVSHGPYRFTRNPMYTGMAAAYLGGAFIMNSGWAFVMLPLVMLALYRFIIQREEKYLSAAFPDDYARYRERVRRWL